MNKIHLNFRRNKALCIGVEQSATQEWEYIKIIWKAVIIFPCSMMRKGFFLFFYVFFSIASVQFISVCSVMSNSLQPHGLQHARLPCPPKTPGACWNSCPSSEWCHPTISSYVIPFSSCLQSFPASESYPMSQFFTLARQSIGVSGSASILLMYIQNWFPLGLTGLISLQSKRLSRVFSNITVQSINSLVLSFVYGPTLASIHDYWKNHSFDYTDLCS